LSLSNSILFFINSLAKTYDLFTVGILASVGLLSSATTIPQKQKSSVRIRVMGLVIIVEYC
jgi:hypothetical protein